MFDKKLSEDDKKWLVDTMRHLIHEEFLSALFREITVQRAARGSGEVDGKIEKSTENVLDMLVRWLPFTEGALRGSQEDINKATNQMNKTSGKVDQLGETLISMQDSVETMARFAVALKETGFIEIEYKNPKAIEDEANTG
jgi:hypothetical protein